MLSQKGLDSLGCSSQSGDAIGKLSNQSITTRSSNKNGRNALFSDGSSREIGKRTESVLAERPREVMMKGVRDIVMHTLVGQAKPVAAMGQQQARNDVLSEHQMGRVNNGGASVPIRQLNGARSGFQHDYCVVGDGDEGHVFMVAKVCGRGDQGLQGENVNWQHFSAFQNVA